MLLHMIGYSPLMVLFPSCFPCRQMWQGEQIYKRYLLLGYYCKMMNLLHFNYRSICINIQIMDHLCLPICICNNRAPRFLHLVLHILLFMFICFWSFKLLQCCCYVHQLCSNSIFSPLFLPISCIIRTLIILI